MKFGHVATEDLDQIDLNLPKDFSGNSNVLDSGKSGPCDIVLGCAKWGISEWKGKVYPEKTKVKDFLPAYINAFNGVELNNTFYRLSRSAIEDCAQTAAEHDFVYCPKWSRRVSHLKRLKEDADENVEYFRESCKLLARV
jgi:uncharacterized protein YecE (DUF72 family)